MIPAVKAPRFSFQACGVAPIRGTLFHAQMRRDGAEPAATGPAHRRRMGVHPGAAAVLPDAGIGLEGEPCRLDTERFEKIEQPGIGRTRQPTVETASPYSTARDISSAAA